VTTPQSNEEQLPTMEQHPADEEIFVVPSETTDISTLDLLDHRGIDWGRVRRTAFLVHQHLRYEYPEPISDLNHRLVIIPPEFHGDQRRVIHRLEVSAPDVEQRASTDQFGNLVVDLYAPSIATAIDFEAWIVVERQAADHGQRLPTTALSDRRFLLPTRLTYPDAALHEAAAYLRDSGDEGIELAMRINMWVFRTMTYSHDVTDVHTTASDALAHRRGVCQDFAHVMLCLCRLCELPARYVSGHLLGEGGTHAWVEVLLPSPDRPRMALAYPFDPTHGRQVGMSYLTVATGRDYQDVAPTSGSFRAAAPGHLSARKHVGLTALEYAAVG